MLKRTTMKWILCVALAVQAGAIVGCQSTSGSEPQALTGDAHAGQGKPRVQWHGKGSQWGTVTTPRQ